MATAAAILFLLCAPIPSLAQVRHEHRNLLLRAFSRRSNLPPEGYFDPMDNGGNMLTMAPNTFPAGLGEPLNVIISGNSDAAVLKDQENDGGLRNYFLSFSYASECLGQHLGDSQAANLGDGHGSMNQTAELRWDFGDPQLGSCKESIEGGAHFRYWVQNGPSGNSGAIFIAASYELPLTAGHDIVVNGYNLGRDWMVGNATNQTSLIPTTSITNTSTYSGKTSFGNYTYQTDVSYVSGLLQNSSNGVNHYLSVGVNGSSAIDGLVAVMQVKIVQQPSVAASGALPISPIHRTWILIALVAFLHSLVSL